MNLTDPTTLLTVIALILAVVGIAFGDRYPLIPVSVILLAIAVLLLRA